MKTAGATIICYIIALLPTVISAQTADLRKKGIKSNKIPTTVYHSKATGQLTGKILDAVSGEMLTGARVEILNTKLGAIADVEGNYQIDNIQPGEYVLRFTYLGYDTLIVNGLSIQAGESNNIPVSLQAHSKEIDAVVITADIDQASEAALTLLQLSTTQISDNISGKTILAQSNDFQSSTVLRRMPGVTLVEDRYLCVRGLFERYNNILLNGSPMPVTAVERQGFDYNLIPASFLTNVRIHKTGTADQFSEFAGGLVFLQTPDLPTENTFRLNLQTVWNTYTTFQPFHTTTTTREVLPGFPAPDYFPQAFPTTANYQQAGPDRQIQAAKLLDNNWFPKRIQAPPGIQFNAFGQKKWELDENSHIGVVAGLTYTGQYIHSRYQFKTFDFYYDSLTQATQTDSGLLKLYLQNRLLSGMANFTWRISPQHTIRWFNLFSFLTENSAKEDRGNYFNPAEDSTQNIEYLVEAVRFQQQLIHANQLTGEHQFQNTRLKWLLFFNGSQQIEPFQRPINYIYDTDANTWRLEDLQGLYTLDALYTTSQQSDKYTGGDIQLSHHRQKNAHHFWLRGGCFYNHILRNFAGRTFIFLPTANFARDSTLLLYSRGADLYNPENIGIDGLMLEETTDSSHHFLGKAWNIAPNISADWQIHQWYINAGLRFENYRTRLTGEDINHTTTFTIQARNWQHWLPSFNVRYALSSHQNLRFAFWKTLSRPGLRELSRLLYHNTISSLLWSSNSDLEPCRIYNVDLRYEWSNGGSNLFSCSLFGKKLLQPIELFSELRGRSVDIANGLINRDNAWIGGLEIEWRQQLGTLFDGELWQYLTYYGNLSLMRSRVNIDNLSQWLKPGLPLQGQAGYLITQSIYCNLRRWNIALFYNRAAKRIAIAGNRFEDGSQYLTTWEMPRDLLDFQLTYLPTLHWEVRLFCQDILNSALVWRNIYDFERHRYNSARDPFIRNERRGQSFFLGITYKW
jgi:hypothetical protein